MLTDFAARFDSYYSTRFDLRLYHECSGYRYEGDYRVWEPTDPVDVEPEQQYGPGAMAVGEIDNYDCSDCDEF